MKITMTKAISEPYAAILNIRACLGCGKCVEKCQMGAIPHSLIGLFSSLLKIDKIKCTGCGDCVHICPQNAIKLAGLSTLSVKFKI